MKRLAIFGALAALIVVPALAQVPAKPPAARAPAKTLAASVSQSPHPTFDEGSVNRIAQAMLSYAALEVQGGWPTLSAGAKLAAGSRGPDVALLRQRLAMTEDLAPDQAAGDLYDDILAAAVRHFELRHGLEPTGSVGPKTLAALNVPVTKRLRQLAGSLDRLAATDFRFGQRYVVVNLPAAFAEAIDGAQVVRRYVVQVGRPERRRPRSRLTSLRSTSIRPGRCRSASSRRMSSRECARTRAMRRACTCGSSTGAATRSMPMRSTGIPIARPISPSPGCRPLERARRAPHRHAQLAFRLHA